MTKKMAALTAGGLLLLAGGCVLLVLAAPWGESSATAKKHFCNSLDNLATTVTNYQGLDVSTASNDQLNQAADDIYGAWDDVVNDANDWANAYDNPLSNAYDNLYWAIQDLPDDQTIAEDYADLQDELAAFPGAFHETFDGSGCPAS